MRLKSAIAGITAAVVCSDPLVGQEGAPSSAIFGLIFKRIDADGDGRVTKAELEKQGRKTEWLTSADADGDGSLTMEEMKIFFEKRKASESSETTVLVHEFPERAPVDEASCRAAAEYSAKANGFSTLVMVEGQTVFEQYDQGWAPEKANRLASGTKSFSGVLLAMAVQDGLLKLDEPVAATIHEWKERPDLETITIRQLLSLTSGLHPGDVGTIPSYAIAIEVSEKEKTEAKPGEKFAYGPRPFQIFGEIMTRKLAASEAFDFPDPLAYLEARIFSPIELVYADWKRDESGMPRLPSGAYLTAREWVKFGELLRNEGRLGEEVLFDLGTFQDCLKGSETYAGYGVTFWLLDAKEERLEGRPWLKGAYMAAGAGKQRLYVLPAAGVVIVRQGESKKEFEDIEMLDRMFSIETSE